MFLFRGYETVKAEEKVVEEKQEEDFIIDSIYVISLNGEPVSFRKDRVELFKKIEEMKDRLKFELVCEGKKVYEDMDYDKEFCSLFAKRLNSVFGGESLEYVISWKKVNNN